MEAAAIAQTCCNLEQNLWLPSSVRVIKTKNSGCFDEFLQIAAVNSSINYRTNKKTLKCYKSARAKSFAVIL